MHCLNVQFSVFRHIVHELRNELCCVRECVAYVTSFVGTALLSAVFTLSICLKLHLQSFGWCFLWLSPNWTSCPHGPQSTVPCCMLENQTLQCFTGWMCSFVGLQSLSGLNILKFFFLFFGKLNVTNKNKCVLCFPGWKGQSWLKKYIYCYYCGWVKKYALGLGQNGQLALDIHIFLTNVSSGCDRKPVYLKSALLKRQFTQKWASVWAMITFQHKTIVQLRTWNCIWT